MNGNWVKLHRKIQRSQLYKRLNSKQRDVMVQCLLMANHEEKEWEWGGQIFKVQAGQFITSLKSLKKNCAKDVSHQNIRTALLILEKWSFLTNKSTKTGRLITVLNWAKYQTKEKANQQTNQQTANKELTTNKNDRRMIEELNTLTEVEFEEEKKEGFKKYQNNFLKPNRHITTQHQLTAFKALEELGINAKDSEVKDKIGSWVKLWRDKPGQCSRAYAELFDSKTFKGYKDIAKVLTFFKVVKKYEA